MNRFDLINKPSSMSGNKPFKKNYENDADFIHNILNEMDEIVYVCDPLSYELVYLNDFGKKTFDVSSYAGKKCFEILHKQSEPCPFCKNEHLTINDFIVWELPVENDHHYLIRDKLISWDNRLLKMGIANDIIHQELTSQNVRKKLQNEQILLKCVNVLARKEKFSDAADIILGHLGEHYEADRAYIYEYHLDEDGKLRASNTHEWCSRGAVPLKEAFQNILVDHFSLWKSQFEFNSNIIIESVETIKDEHPNDYAILKQLNIESITIVPLRLDDKTSGFIGVDNPKANLNDYSLLHSLAFVVMNEQKKRAMERRLRKLSFTDKLTGLGNRNNYIQTLEQLEKIPPPNLGVVFIDLNGLKMVNDQLGHDAGDKYIKNLADVFRKHFREEDIYRIGGDEFVFLTQRIQEPIFREKIETLKKEAHKLYPDSISVGSVWRENNIRPAQMIRKADFLMYENKKEYYLRRDAKQDVS